MRRLRARRTACPARLRRAVMRDARHHLRALRRHGMRQNRLWQGLQSQPSHFRRLRVAPTLCHRRSASFGRSIHVARRAYRRRAQRRVSRRVSPGALGPLMSHGDGAAARPPSGRRLAGHCARVRRGRRRPNYPSADHHDAGRPARHRCHSPVCDSAAWQERRVGHHRVGHHRVGHRRGCAWESHHHERLAGLAHHCGGWRRGRPRGWGNRPPDWAGAYAGRRDGGRRPGRARSVFYSREVEVSHPVSAKAWGLAADRADHLAHACADRQMVTDAGGLDHSYSSISPLSLR